MPTLSYTNKAREAVTRLVGINNSMLSQAESAKVFLDKIAGLNANQKAKFDAAITSQGMDPAEVHALRVSLSTRVGAIIAALTSIAQKL